MKKKKLLKKSIHKLLQCGIFITGSLNRCLGEYELAQTDCRPHLQLNLFIDRIYSVWWKD